MTFIKNKTKHYEAHLIPQMSWNFTISYEHLRWGICEILGLRLERYICFSILRNSICFIISYDYIFCQYVWRKTSEYTFCMPIIHIWSYTHIKKIFYHFIGAIYLCQLALIKKKTNTLLHLPHLRGKPQTRYYHCPIQHPQLKRNIKFQ